MSKKTAKTSCCSTCRTASGGDPAEPDWAPNHVERIKTLTGRDSTTGSFSTASSTASWLRPAIPREPAPADRSCPTSRKNSPACRISRYVSMARAASPDSANSQFFIVFYPFQPRRELHQFRARDRQHARVDAIQRGEPPRNPTRIVQASIAPVQRPVPADARGCRTTTSRQRSERAARQLTFHRVAPGLGAAR